VPCFLAQKWNKYDKKKYINFSIKIGQQTMPKILPFEQYTDKYENWFIKNRWVYQAELSAVKQFIPKTGQGIEIGIGSGRFARPFGIRLGIEPSANMRNRAKARGIQAIGGVAEKLPLKKSEFTFVLMITTVCFLDDINKSFQEAYRILHPGGHFIVGIVDRESPIGQIYLKHQHENVFYKDATFYTTEEIVKYMKDAGFISFNYRQTIFTKLSKIDKKEPVANGYSKGSFVVICGKKR